MRKRVLVVLALVVCLLAQMVPVFATSGVDIESLPGPPEGAELISFIGLDGSSATGYSYNIGDDGRANAINMWEDAKIVVYDKSSGLYWCYCEATTVIDGVEVVYREYSSFDDVATALANAVSVETGESFSFDVGSTLVWKALSGADAFAVTSDEMLALVNNPYKDMDSFSGSNNTLSVSLVEKLYADAEPVGGTFELKYSLGGYDWNGYNKDEYVTYIKVEPSDTLVHVDSTATSGSVRFTIDALMNGAYTASVSTNAGNVYTTTFNVDFVKASREEYSGSFSAPVVTFDGIPSASDAVENFELIVKTDIPATLIWDGIMQSNAYGTETTVTILQNGTYHYTATSEIGQQTSGELVVDYLNEGVTSESSTVSLAQSLVQTGVNDSFNIGLVIILTVIGVGCAAVAVIVLRRRSNEG